jgi:hypothetical protein
MVVVRAYVLALECMAASYSAPCCHSAAATTSSSLLDAALLRLASFLLPLGRRELDLGISSGTAAVVPSAEASAVATAGMEAG